MREVSETGGTAAAGVDDAAGRAAAGVRGVDFEPADDFGWRDARAGPAPDLFHLLFAGHEGTRIIPSRAIHHASEWGFYLIWGRRTPQYAASS